MAERRASHFPAVFPTSYPLSAERRTLPFPGELATSFPITSSILHINSHLIWGALSRLVNRPLHHKLDDGWPESEKGDCQAIPSKTSLYNLLLSKKLQRN